MSLSLFPPPHVSPFLPLYLFILPIAILIEQMLVMLHPSRSWISKALTHMLLASVGDKYVLSIKSKFKGSVYSGWQNPINRNENLKVERRVETIPRLMQLHDTAATTALRMCVLCSSHIYLGHQLGIRIPYLALFRSFFKLHCINTQEITDLLTNTHLLLTSGILQTVCSKMIILWAPCNLWDKTSPGLNFISNWSILKHLSARMITSPTKTNYIELKHSQKSFPLYPKFYSGEALHILV